MAPTFTSRLGLGKPDPQDLYDVTIDNANMDILDRVGGVTICTSSTRPADPYPGMEIYETDTGQTYVWQDPEAVWLRTTPGAVSGQRYWTTATLATTSGTTEIAAGMSTGPANMLEERLYKVVTRVQWDASVAGDQPIFRVRQNDITGAIWAESVPEAGVKNANVKVSHEFTTMIRTGGAFNGELILTVARLAGTGSIRVYAGPTSWAFMMAEYLGHGSILTDI